MISSLTTSPLFFAFSFDGRARARSLTFMYIQCSGKYDRIEHGRRVQHRIASHSIATTTNNRHGRSRNLPSASGIQSAPLSDFFFLFLVLYFYFQGLCSGDAAMPLLPSARLMDGIRLTSRLSLPINPPRSFHRDFSLSNEIILLLLRLRLLFDFYFFLFST